MKRRNGVMESGVSGEGEYGEIIYMFHTLQANAGRQLLTVYCLVSITSLARPSPSAWKNAKSS